MDDFSRVDSALQSLQISKASIHTSPSSLPGSESHTQYPPQSSVQTQPRQMSERRRRREVNAEEGEQHQEEEKEEEDVVYWLVKKPKNVPAAEIQSMRCPRKPRHTKRVLETSDGQLLEAHFEEPKRRMFTLKPKSTSLQKETKKFKPDADVLGMVHISRSMNPDEMTQPQKDYFYATEDPNEMK